MLDALLQYTVHGTVPPVFLEKRAAVTLNSVDLPERMEGRFGRIFSLDPLTAGGDFELKRKICKKLEKSLEPCHIGIHLKALAELF